MAQRKKRSTKEKEKNTKKIRSLVLAAVLLAVSVYGSYIYFTVQKFDNRILNGIKIENVDLSGKTKEDALNILKSKYSDVTANKKINIKTKDRNYKINYSEIGAKYNISETVEEAIKYGKDLNIISKYKVIKDPKVKPYNLKLSYDIKPIEKVIDTIAKDVNRDAKNASIKLVNGNFQVVPEECGQELERDKLKQEIIANIDNIANTELNVDAPIKSVNAKIKGDSLKSVNSKIASFSTDFTSSSYPRATNVRVATKSINGTILMPGDVFSFNDIVGQRTKARGYQEAGVIVNQKLEKGLGGGVCQVSSTLYNAILKANLKTTERVHHTFPSHYVKKGLDATVDFGNIDLKFKNTFDYPIYIEGYTSNKQLFFNIYANSVLNKRSYDITTEVYSQIEPKTRYINDSSLPIGKTEIVKKAHTGYRVKVYKNIYENGNFVSKERISNDYYVPVDAVIKRGTKK